MENKAIIKCTNVIDDSYCTVIILKYKVYRDDTGKLFGRFLALKHKVENFLKEVLDEDLIFQSPVLQRTKDGLLDLFQKLSTLCSGVSPPRGMSTVPELAPETDGPESCEMKFVKGGNTPSEVWLCYVDNRELLNLLKRLSEKYDNDELEPFIFYPRIGEHVYFKQGQNIFRGIVQEYVMPDENDDDGRVDVKVLNMDNSDMVTLPQSCIFQMDKDGIDLPMQCVLCSLLETESSSVSESQPVADLSVNILKKHKLNVTFLRKKVTAKSSPVTAQCVTIALSTDKAKDKKNGFNVNSKEFVPRNSIPNDALISPGVASDAELRSDETTRSSSPGSSQDDAIEKPSAQTVPSSSDHHTKDPTVVVATVAAPNSSVAAAVATTASVAAAAVSNLKERPDTNNKSYAMNHVAKSGDSGIVANAYRSPPHAHDREQPLPRNAPASAYNRYGHNKVPDAVAASAKGGKSVSAIVDKLKNAAAISSPNNENRTKVTGVGGIGPPSSPHSSQTQSPASVPPNAQMPPYLFIPPGQVPFHGQYVPIPAGAAAAAVAAPPHQLGSSMPVFLPPYPPAYLPPAPPPPASAHSQPYHMPPAAATASSPYQPYMQPMAVAPFFSQPPYSQQFYQASHLQHTWSHLPPFHVAGGPLPHQGGGGGGGGGGGKADISAGPGMSKFK